MYTFVKKGQTVVLQLGVYYFNNCWLYFTVYICLNHNLLLNKQLTQGRLTHFITFHLMTLFTNYIHLRHESIMFPHDDLILVMPLSLYHLSCSGFLGGVIAVCSIPFLHHLFTCFI